MRLWQIADRNPHHLLVTYGDGRLSCFVDGEQVASSNKIEGDFSTWTNHYLMLADEWQTSGDSQGWRGDILALAIYDRVLDANEALRNAAAVRTLTQ